VYSMRVEIEGITPLLQNKFIEDQEVPQKKGEAHDSPDLVPYKLYKNDKGEIVVPSEWIIRAMERVASEFKVEGMKKVTYKNLLPGNIYIEPEAIRIEPQKYSIDKRTVVIPSTRGRIMRYRPRFEKGWKLAFTIRVFDDRIKKEVLKHILEDTGRRVGIGDARRIGMGRFIVTRFDSIG